MCIIRQALVLLGFSLIFGVASGLHGEQPSNEQVGKALAASRFSLSAQSMELKELFDEVHKQTGNRLTDYRKQFGQSDTDLKIQLEIEDEPFWTGIDKILDQVELAIYPYSGEEALGVIQREQGAASRAKQASYVGPFRIEPINVVTERNLRNPTEQGGRIELEIAWEPRLRPIAITQSTDALKITAADGSLVQIGDEQKQFTVEAQPGSHATELYIPFELPPRSITKLSTLRGELSALVPGEIAEFRFEDLSPKKPTEQQRAGVKVVLNLVRKNQHLWEIHMRLCVESDETDLESHRGWVFQNLTYLQNKQGEMIDHVGFETTMQSKKEIGLAYLFDLPDDQIGDYTWVYHTPAAMVRMPINYELKDIALP